MDVTITVAILQIRRVENYLGRLKQMERGAVSAEESTSPNADREQSFKSWSVFDLEDQERTAGH